MSIRFVLRQGLGLGRGELLGLAPATRRFLEAEALPCSVSRSVEHQHAIEMGGCLWLQVVLLAPERQFPLILRSVRRLDSLLLVLLGPVRVVRILVDRLADLLRTLPLPIVGDQA